MAVIAMGDRRALRLRRCEMGWLDSHWKIASGWKSLLGLLGLDRCLWPLLLCCHVQAELAPASSCG